MNKLKVTLHILLFAIVAMGCDRHYSADKIHDSPTFDKEFLNTALEHLNNSIEDYPSNPDNYYKKALILMELESYGSALLQAKKAQNLNKNDPEYLYLLANLYSINDKTDEALEAALKAVTVGTSKSRLYNLMAEIYLEKGAIEKGMENIERAIALNPSNKNYHFVKGKIFLEKGDTVSAEREFLFTLDKSFVHKEAYLNLSNIYIAQKKYEKSNQIIENLLKDSPKDVDVLHQKALVLNKLEQLDSGRFIYEQIIKLDSSNQEASNKLASYFFYKNNLDSADYYAEKSLTMGENKIFPLLMQARILDKYRKYYEAISKYESVLAIDSTYKPAADELRYVRNKIIYIQRQKAAQRQQELQEVPTIEPFF